MIGKTKSRYRIALVVIAVTLLALCALWMVRPLSTRSVVAEYFQVTSPPVESDDRVVVTVREVVKKHPELASDMLRVFRMVKRMPPEAIRSGEEAKIADAVKNLIVMEDADASSTKMAQPKTTSQPAVVPAEAKDIVHVATTACDQIKKINSVSSGSGMAYLGRYQPDLAVTISRLIQACQK